MTVKRNLWPTAQATVLPVLAGLFAASAHALPTLNLSGATYNNVAVSGVNVVTGTIGGTISNTKGDVIFARDSTQPSGTGVFNPFLRLDCKGNGCDEQGYNTNGVKGDASNGYTTRKVLDNMSPVNWTHDVLISTLQLDSTGKYYQFKLDINEPGNANSLLSLDGVKLYSTSAPGQYGQELDTPPPGNATYDWVGPTSSTLLWDMDLGKGQNDDNKDRSVLLDARAAGGPGSGVADMIMLVDRNVIDVAKGNGQDYLILWSRFGMDQGAKADTDTTAEAGFEEWSYQAKVGTPTNGGGGGQVPAPATAMLVAVGLLAMTRTRTRSEVPAPASA